MTMTEMAMTEMAMTEMAMIDFCRFGIPVIREAPFSMCSPSPL
jgi:hypothetical protein